LLAFLFQMVYRYLFLEQQLIVLYFTNKTYKYFLKEIT